MSQKKMEIHLGQNLADLLKLSDISNLLSNLSNSPEKKLMKMAEILVEEGGKALKTGDEEQAFVRYVQAASFYMRVKERSMQYKDPKQQKYIQQTIKHKLGKVLNNAELLKTSLQERYSKLRTAENLLLQVQKLQAQNEMLKTELDTAREENQQLDSKTSLLNELISKMEKDCICSICIDVFKEPSTLPCGHTFCQPCLHQWLLNNHVCPTCRHVMNTHDCPKKNVSMCSLIEKMTMVTTTLVTNGGKSGGRSSEQN